MTQQSPIGVFDSGVGGLSIAKSVHTLMPNEHIIYIADHFCSPYGTQSTETLLQRTSLIVKYFITRGCKAIVVACNTATVHTISYLRSLTSIPIIGVEPALKPASELSKTGVVGLLATQQTINSKAIITLTSRFAEKIKVESVACPLFVELVEQGQLNNDITQQTVKNYIESLMLKSADHLVLGCTHFAFLIPSIEYCVNELTTKPITIVEPSTPVCMELNRQLTIRGLLSNSVKGSWEFYSTYENGFEPNKDISLNDLFSLLWQQPIKVNRLVLDQEMKKPS